MTKTIRGKAAKLSRRHFVVLSAGVVTARLFGQGVAPRSVKPETKPAPSGRAFDAHFTDVAREAGLTAPVIYAIQTSRITFSRPLAAGALSLTTTTMVGWISFC